MNGFTIGAAGANPYQARDGTPPNSSFPALRPDSRSADSSSDTLTLSPEAQALASLNAQGVTVAQVPLTDTSLVGPSHLVDAGGIGGAVSQGDFEKVASQFGLSRGDADQLFKQMDTDGDGALSNTEFIDALGKTGGGGAANLSSELLRMMDTNHDGTVSATEFLDLESAVVEAEKSPVQM